MVLCPKCDNILTKATNTGHVRFICASCGHEAKASGIDTLIYQEGAQKIEMKKSGKTIFWYAANPKMHYPGGCPKCKESIVGWELDRQLQKIYGCKCGYSWKQTLDSAKA